MIRNIVSAALVASALFACPAFAQTDEAPAAKEPRRIRVGAGAQVAPRFPGASDHTILPYFDISLARGDDEFAYEAPDESVGFSMIKTSGFEFGPVVNFEGKRRRKDVGANVDEVGLTVEAGGFVQFWLSPSFRVRGELRQGIGGHKSLVGNAGFDYVARDSDKWVFSVGPRIGYASRKYQAAYFGVNGREAAATGLPVYRPKAGINTVGAAAGLDYSINKTWGIMSFAKYDRLIGDAGDSPLVRRYGKRDQLSGGIGLTYTFGGNR